MKTYKAKVRSWGFQGRLWEVGQTVIVGDDVVVPPHFEQIDKIEPEKPLEKEKPIALSQLAKRPEITTGFAASQEDVAKKRGRPKKVAA